jgi:hypothetical protein
VKCPELTAVCRNDEDYVKSDDLNNFVKEEDIEKMKSNYALTHYDFAEMTIQYGRLRCTLTAALHTGCHAAH